MIKYKINAMRSGKKEIKMGRLFGTDGVRGVANEELTPQLAMQLGQAGAYVLTKENAHKTTIRNVPPMRSEQSRYGFSWTRSSDFSP